MNTSHKQHKHEKEWNLVRKRLTLDALSALPWEGQADSAKTFCDLLEVITELGQEMDCESSESGSPHPFADGVASSSVIRVGLVWELLVAQLYRTG